jgi:acetyl esterase/lipase
MRLPKKLILYIVVIACVVSCSKQSTTPPPDETVASTLLNSSYGTDEKQKMDIYLPAGRSTATTKAILLLHGGAWILGDKTDFGPFVDTLKKRLPDYAIFNINYRLSAFPNSLFPTQENDVKAAVNFISSNSATYKISNKMVIAGASAGAHLAMLQAYKNSTPIKFNAVVNFFGPTDLIELYNNPGSIPQNTIASIIGATPASNNTLYLQSSPINFAVAGSACPTLILQGTNDPLVNHITQSEALRNKLQLANVPVQYVAYAGKGHGDDWDAATYANAFNNIQSFLALHNP